MIVCQNSDFIQINLEKETWNFLRPLSSTIITTSQRSYRKVMFSVMCVCLFTGSPCTGSQSWLHPPPHRVPALAPQTCSNLFNFDDLTVQEPPPSNMSKVWSEDCWRTGAWHSTEMPSCLLQGWERGMVPLAPPPPPQVPLLVWFYIITTDFMLTFSHQVVGKSHKRFLVKIMKAQRNVFYWKF